MYTFSHLEIEAQTDTSTHLSINSSHFWLSLFSNFPFSPFKFIYLIYSFIIASTEYYSSSSDERIQNTNVLWEHGDDNYTSANSSSSLSQSPLASQLIHPPIASQPTTLGVTSPFLSVKLSSQESDIFFPISSSTSVPLRKWDRKPKGHRFHGNRFVTAEINSRTLYESSTRDSSADISSMKPKSKRFRFTLPRRGYISKFSTPFLSEKSGTILASYCYDINKGFFTIWDADSRYRYTS